MRGFFGWRLLSTQMICQAHQLYGLFIKTSYSLSVMNLTSISSPILLGVYQASSGSKANDREEIRRRLAMGDAEDDAAADYYCGERVKRKPNLATRLK